jgi:hypothetical protein
VLRDVELRLLDSRVLQVLGPSTRRRSVGLGEAVPASRSRSSVPLRGMGNADDEESLTDSATWAWISSSLSSIYGS